MTLEEFEEAYAEGSGVTVEELHAMGLYGEPCDCGDDLCWGWQMNWEQRRERAAPEYKL